MLDFSQDEPSDPEAPEPSATPTFAPLWNTTMSEEQKRRFYKNWYLAKKKAFTRYAKPWPVKEKDQEKETKQKLR